ncbi:hypothetical protein C8Q76DRAFT_712930 [Earliella scabrosa]|nr:hypothetical protein C8Q76DRAFT_712930 [Earliella scabrosa]
MRIPCGLTIVLPREPHFDVDDPDIHEPPPKKTPWSQPRTMNGTTAKIPGHAHGSPDTSGAVLTLATRQREALEGAPRNSEELESWDSPQQQTSSAAPARTGRRCTVLAVHTKYAATDGRCYIALHWCRSTTPAAAYYARHRVLIVCWLEHVSLRLIQCRY